MPDDPYTHKFKFNIGDVGQFAIEGECEFNTDGKMTYDIQSTSKPFPQETLELFTELMARFKEIYEKSGGIRLIQIKKKE